MKKLQFTFTAGLIFGSIIFSGCLGRVRRMWVADEVARQPSEPLEASGKVSAADTSRSAERLGQQEPASVDPSEPAYSSLSLSGPTSVDQSRANFEPMDKAAPAGYADENSSPGRQVLLQSAQAVLDDFKSSSMDTYRGPSTAAYVLTNAAGDLLKDFEHEAYLPTEPMARVDMSGAKIVSPWTSLDLH